MAKNTKFRVDRLVISIALCQMAGVVGSLFTAPAISSWYNFLVKPSFSPPNWLFGPVWIALYTLMGIALYLIWQKGLSKKNVLFLYSFFLTHLVVNASWSIIFFGMRNILLALVTIFMLWVMIVFIMIEAVEIDKRITYLMTPYLLWVTFASLLNGFIFFLNR